MAQPPSSSAPPSARHPSAARWDCDRDVEAEILACEPQNFVLLTLYQIVMRVGWIFKTESVLIPYFLDLLAGPGWVRGLLPVLNRFGQSVPPVLFAGRLARAPHKTRLLALWTGSMGLPLLVLAALWAPLGLHPPAWLAPLFLLLYAVFSITNGLNQLCYSTTQGKLIRAEHRGRLMSASTFLGSGLAVAFVWWLLPDWLAQKDHGFVWIWGFSGACFVGCALCALAVREPPDESPPHDAPADAWFHDSLRTLRENPNFRLLTIVGMLFSVNVILFPHYQALGRVRLLLVKQDLMWWVVVQNIAVAVCGLALGPLADRHGTRLALRLSIVLMAIAPGLAVVLAWLGPERGGPSYWMIYAPMGLTPLALKLFTNYTLEISAPADHPRYLSTLSLTMAIPFLGSPLVGWAVDLVGFEPVFLTGCGLIVLGALLTFWLTEPRVTHVVWQDGPAESPAED